MRGHAHHRDRLLALLLTWMLLVPAALPIYLAAQSDASGVPACCRHAGQHHCLMTQAERDALEAASPAPHITAPAQQCPFRTYLLAHSSNHDVFGYTPARYWLYIALRKGNLYRRPMDVACRYAAFEQQDRAPPITLSI